MKITANTPHLMERANRALSRLPQSVSEKKIREWLSAIRRSCPPDWRFSENSQGEFLVTVIDDDARVQLKFLGRSYRMTRNWTTLWQGINELLASGQEPEDADIRRLAHFYREDQCQWDGDIRHELKTILSPRMVPSSSGRLDEYEGEPHMSVLTGNGLHYNLARRPNALLVLRGGAEPELLVRQGAPYIRAFDNGSDRSISLCVFAKLGPSGIKAGSGQCWRVSGNGVLYPNGSARCWPTSRPEREDLPDGFRSQSYWQLPLKLDAWFEELSFLAKRADISDDHEVARSLRLVTRIREAAATFPGGI